MKEYEYSKKDLRYHIKIEKRVLKYLRKLKNKYWVNVGDLIKEEEITLKCDKNKLKEKKDDR
jgi:hypothetical protein